MKKKKKKKKRTLIVTKQSRFQFESARNRIELKARRRRTMSTEEEAETEAANDRAEQDQVPKPSVVFGSGSALFGANQTKFGQVGFNASAFTIGSQNKGNAAEDDDRENTDGQNQDDDVERECTKEFQPVVKLEIIENMETKTTGEERELVRFEAKTKAYRFLEGEWKERGLGPMKILEHKETKKCRLLMRRDKTLKICANFYIDPETKMDTHAGNEKARVFTTVDCSDGDEAPQLQNMCIKFGSEAKAQQFQDAFVEAQKTMRSLPKSGEEEEKEENEREANENADDLAEDLAEKLATKKKDDDDEAEEED